VRGFKPSSWPGSWDRRLCWVISFFGFILFICVSFEFLNLDIRFIQLVLHLTFDRRIINLRSIIHYLWSYSSSAVICQSWFSGVQCLTNGADASQMPFTPVEFEIFLILFPFSDLRVCPSFLPRPRKGIREEVE